MWPWTHPKRTNTELFERIESLERKFKAIQTDWDSTFEKFARLNARMAQRWKRLVEAEDAQDAPDDSSNDSRSARATAPVTTNPLALELLRGIK